MIDTIRKLVDVPARIEALSRLVEVALARLEQIESHVAPREEASRLTRLQLAVAQRTNQLIISAVGGEVYTRVLHAKARVDGADVNNLTKARTDEEMATYVREAVKLARLVEETLESSIREL